MCTITLSSIIANSATSIAVSGTVEGDCPTLNIVLRLPDNTSLTGEATIEDGSTSATRTWRIVFKDVDVLASWCKDSEFTVEAKCEGGREECEEKFRDKPLECCPTYNLIDFSTGECDVRPSGNYRPLSMSLRVNWPDGFEEAISLLFSFWIVGESDNPDQRTIVATPDTANYTEGDFFGSGNLLLRADFEYEGRIEFVLPERCEQTRTIPPFNVPDCDCERPPAPEEFLTVKYPDNTVVVDPNNTGCVDGDTAIITAEPWPGEIEWYATDGENDIPFTVDPSDPRTIRVSIPEDGTRVEVTAEVGIGDCREPVVITVKRCGKTPQPPPPTPPPPPPDTGDRTTDVTVDLCLLFRIFFLIGLGLVALGAVMLLCPGFSWFPDPATNAIVGGGVAAVGALLFIIFFLIWIFVCKPKPCDWLLVLWQALSLVGAVFTYAAFCPQCVYLGFGVLGILAGFGCFIWWVFACKPTLCRMYLELLVFILFVVDVVSIVEIILGRCVLTSDWWYALIWAGALLALKGLAFNGLRKNRCNVTFG